MKNTLAFLFVLIQATLAAQDGPRQTITIPDVEGYKVLKADVHMHTVFSDGLVWPDFRVNEAWQEGLDVIAITEHIEYRPNKADVNGDHNRAYQIAREAGQRAGIVVIPGSEITRRMPPGHFNALFITDANKLDVPDWKDAFREARRQGAFIFWNHPGWKAQQPDSALWLPEHQMLYDSGCMHGIEVANYNEWYPIVMRWASRPQFNDAGQLRYSWRHLSAIRHPSRATPPDVAPVCNRQKRRSSERGSFCPSHRCHVQRPFIRHRRVAQQTF